MDENRDDRSLAVQAAPEQVHHRCEETLARARDSAHSRSDGPRIHGEPISEQEPESQHCEAEAERLLWELAYTEFELFMDKYRQLRHRGTRAELALQAAATHRVAAWHALDPHLIELPLLASIAVRARPDHRQACAGAAAALLGVRRIDEHRFE